MSVAVGGGWASGGYGTSEFEAEYQAALARASLKSKRASRPQAHSHGSLSGIGRLRRGEALRGRSGSGEYLPSGIASAGDKPVSRITTETIAAAANGVDTVSGAPLPRHYAGAISVGGRARPVKATRRPSSRIRSCRRPAPASAVWTEEDVAAYERRWPIGTRQRVWLDVLLYTGLRRGDAVRFGRQHVRDGIGTIKTEKTGDRGDAADPAGARSRPWRPARLAIFPSSLISTVSRSPRNLRQRVQGCLPRCSRSRIGTRVEKDRSD